MIEEAVTSVELHADRLPPFFCRQTLTCPLLCALRDVSGGDEAMAAIAASLPQNNGPFQGRN